MSQLKVGIVGMGARGMCLLEQVVVPSDKMEVAMVCDSFDDRLEKAVETVYQQTGKKPLATKDYQQMLNKERVDCILICTSWQSHFPMTIDALNAGIPVGMEVGNAFSIEQCWDLVKTWERTKTPFMFLENCCYGRRELMALNMTRLGVFGSIVHCAGGYQHDLRKQVAFGYDNRHYRIDNYLLRNCDNYPTHELGPIARILNLNRGNRMLTLTSMASKAGGIEQYIADNKPDDTQLVGRQFRQGDIVTTIIKCAGGETITLTLDTCLPRYYSRGFTVRGTKGMYEEVTDSVFLSGQDEPLHEQWQEQVGNAKKYAEKYEHPMWRRFLNDGVRAGHGGMDWLILHDFADALLRGEDPAIDVYDAAGWMSIGCLTENSIAMGGMPVAIPDFTNGAWMTRKPS